ncbi:MAG: hypothetical protein CVT96_11910 [Bacteroidetes bacterium HGW-Bacteroidetes-13]|nr:MAG: hypothetical protein CVT96_11910 [Bacteroidetes bacterium HGW-Bacteroidetes-13]
MISFALGIAVEILFWTFSVQKRLERIARPQQGYEIGFVGGTPKRLFRFCDCSWDWFFFIIFNHAFA